jgi:hypothetical protein
MFRNSEVKPFFGAQVGACDVHSSYLLLPLTCISVIMTKYFLWALGVSWSENENKTS